MPRTEHDLSRLLTEAGVAHDILTAHGDTPTVETAAAALGVPADSIVKTLVFADRRDAERFVVVIARGLTRIADRKLRAVTPGKWRMAKPDEVERVTGYVAGAVPPVMHATAQRVLMDARVAELDSCVGGGGGLTASLRIAVADVQRLMAAEVVDLVDG